jgi:hypothetical protein
MKQTIQAKPTVNAGLLPVKFLTTGFTRGTASEPDFSSMLDEKLFNTTIDESTQK